MKSLTLHLRVTLLLLLLVGFLQQPTAHSRPSLLLLVTTAAAATASTTVPTKPQPSPSLLAAQQPLPTTLMAGASTALPSTTSRQRQLAARQSARPTSVSPPVSAHIVSAGLVRNANTAVVRNGVRQNRSLQSTLSAAAGAEDNGSSNNHVDGNVDDATKYNRSERRPQYRTNRYSGGGSRGQTTTTTTAITATAAITTTPASRDTFDEIADEPHQARQATQQQPLTGDRLKSTQPNQQTLKTPRMIQRLVAGHIQNAEGHSTYEVSSVTTNSTVTSSTATSLNPSSLYFRRKDAVQSSSYRHAPKLPAVTIGGTTTPKSVIQARIHDIPAQHNDTNAAHATAAADDDDDDGDEHDDEALLDDPGDFDNWENGILRLSAGSGKESTTKAKKNKDDPKKTLSDQVRDGKYGLIEKELFRQQPKRPGVLSYLRNKEVPTDNERNYGGLRDEDIWLAEDHLLVIKGGSLNDGESDEPWPPIDDYDSPPRQIKIPPNPKVPPPFPVQLEENGPIQFIGNNKFTVVFPVANESIPVYPAGPEVNYPPAEGDRNNEKNILARPGSLKDTTEGGQDPAYVYPAPSPPWLYHNQTFVNPFLTNTRPITFPGLGPFPFNRNGSLDNSDGSEDFDEDDPSLYYPPAYSFVYESNYSNPVPPGPLVPGIVLPPPTNQFSRLQKPKKSTTTTTSTTSTTTTTAAPPPPPPPRYRPHPTTTTTSTTTTTTTQLPFRQVYTKITEYTPKTIIINPAPPASSSAPSVHPHPHSHSHSSTPSTTVHLKLPSTPSSLSPPSRKAHPPVIQPVPVPVAVPIPIYPTNNYPTPRPDIVTFVPTTPDPSIDTFSKSNPIYYEYFEAKRQPATANNIDNFLSSTTTAKPPPPPSHKPVKIYATSKRPFKQQQHRHHHQQPQQQQQPQPLPNHRNYLQPINQPNRQYFQDNVVYITPKPEVRYKLPSAQAPLFKPRPLENFEREVNVIRETLRYYQNQQLRDNTIPRTPKAKPVYEYSGYDAANQLQASPATNNDDDENSNTNFQPPAAYDEEPFQPMVTYSPPVGDENAFRAIAYDKVDSDLPQQGQQHESSRYPTTTTLNPVQPEPQYPQQQPQQGRPKKLRLRAKYLQPTVVPKYEQQLELDYQSTPRAVVATQPPWQEFNEYTSAQQQQQLQQQHQQQHHQREQLQRQQQQQSQRQLPEPGIATKHRQSGFNGYYYNAPAHHGHRQNNRFYDEPFQAPVRKIINYRPQAHPAPQHQQQWSLENDTYVNYAPNRPPLNPDAEFINPYQTLPLNAYTQGQVPQRQQHPISHQAQYYAQPQRLPFSSRPQQQQPIPLHRDVLVNYRQPLPPINPDSEYISHPQVVRNQGNQIYRPNPYRLIAAASHQIPDGGSPLGEPANVYFLTPKYRRSSSNNKNNENGNTNDNTGSDNNGK